MLGLPFGELRFSRLAFVLKPPCLGPQMVESPVAGNAGEPASKRPFALKGVETVERGEENFLSQIVHDGCLSDVTPEETSHSLVVLPDQLRESFVGTSPCFGHKFRNGRGIRNARHATHIKECAAASVS